MDSSHAAHPSRLAQHRSGVLALPNPQVRAADVYLSGGRWLLRGPLAAQLPVAVTVDVACSFAHTEIRTLLPAGRTALSATLDGDAVTVCNELVERSTYAVLTIEHPPRGPLTIHY